jgi:hypothetical protein
MIHLINSKELKKTIEVIDTHLSNGGFVVFIEVTNEKVYKRYIPYENNIGKVYFIDPQHTVAGHPGNLRFPTECSNYSAVRYTYEMWREIYFNIIDMKEVLYVIEKADMDAIASLVLVEWIRWLEKDFKLADSQIERIYDIDAIDSWKQPVEWSPSYKQQYIVNWSNILGAAMCDWKQPIESRVNYMNEFLKAGILPEVYRTQIEAEWRLLTESNVETFYGITVATTQARGVSGLIYNQAPYGIGYNPEFNINGVVAPKYTVMEFTGGKYLDLAGFFKHMNDFFPDENGTWGGNINGGIGGSPHGCSLTPEVVANELKKFVK